MVLAISVHVIAIAIFLFSFGNGSAPEKIAATCLAVWTILGALIQIMVSGADFATLNVFDVVCDITLFCVMLALAVSANRIWPCFLAGSTLLMLFGHAAAWIAPTGMKQAYWAMTNLPFLLALAALFIGTLCHRRRAKILGHYGDWRNVRGTQVRN